MFRPFHWILIVSLLLTACGGNDSTDNTGGSSSSGSSASGSSSGASGNTASSSSSSSSSGTPNSSNGIDVQNLGGFVALPNERGSVNYEPVAITAPLFDKALSLEAFKETLYPFLRESGCAGCHNSAGLGQAPLHSDNDPALAHEYALTRVYFKDPENSKFVVRMRLDRHNCPGDCRDAADDMLDAVEAWKARIENMLPETPRGIPANQDISTAQMTGWMDTDKATIPQSDLPYIVYTSLHELHNEGLTADQLNIVRVGLSKALNSVARWAPELVHPADVTGDGILYKFDIRDYWGYNQGVDEIMFGGSDDDLAFGAQKRNYKGEIVSDTGIQRRKYNFNGNTTRDPEHAMRVWQRVLHGNVEGAVNSGTIPPYIDGFKGTLSSNAAGDYIRAQDLEWVETAQLIYTLTRPDVYNAIMLNPFYADEMEQHLGVDTSDGMDSYDYMVTFDAITVDSRLFWRAKREDGGWYWKTWDIFSGDLASGRDRNIFDVYNDPDGRDIRFPWWANPIPKFVKWLSVADDNTDFSFVASLNQTYGDNGGFGFAGANTEGCNNVRNFAVEGFGYCRNFTGVGGAMQSASEIIYNIPNGLQAYYLTGGFNQRRVDAFTNIVRDPRILTEAEDDIAHATGYSCTNGRGGFRGGDPRLNVGSSCIGCHADGMNRSNNDLRDWLDNNPNRLPTGPYGVDDWIDDPATVARVRELYPPKDEMNDMIEEDRKGFLTAMGKIKDAMIWGEDKNVYVEPIIWTVEHVQRVKYRYPQTRSN